MNNTSSLFTITYYLKFGGVMVSTGILKSSKRVEPGNLFKRSKL